MQCQSERNANQMVNKAGWGIQKVQLFYRRRQQKSSSSAPQGSSIKTQKQRYQSLGGRKQRCWEAQDDEAEKHTET